MRPPDRQSPDDEPRRGKKVYGQKIYVNAYERGTRDRSPKPKHTQPPLERVELKICPKKKYRGRMKYHQTRSIPELCRITLKPTGEKDHDQEELEEVYISQYTHSFDRKIEKPHIVAWKQDFVQRHVKHCDSKMCVMNSPLASKCKDQPERPKSAPPGSLAFDFDRMEYVEPLSRRSTSPGMLADNWMDFDEVDHQDGFRPLNTYECSPAHTMVNHESLGCDVSGERFNTIDKHLFVRRDSYEDDESTTETEVEKKRQLVKEEVKAEMMPQHESLRSTFDMFETLENERQAKKQLVNEEVTAQKIRPYKNLDPSVLDYIFDNLEDKPEMANKIKAECSSTRKVPRNEVVSAQKVATYESVSPSLLDELFGEEEEGMWSGYKTAYNEKDGTAQYKPLTDQNVVAQEEGNIITSTWIPVDNNVVNTIRDNATQNGERVSYHDLDVPQSFSPLVNANAVALRKKPGHIANSAQSDSAFNGLDKEHQNKSEDLTQQARSLISSLRSSVKKTPKTFRKTFLHTVHTPKPMKATTVNIPQEKLPHQHPTQKASYKEHTPQEYSSSAYLPQKHLTYEPSPDEHLPYIQKAVLPQTEFEPTRNESEEGGRRTSKSPKAQRRTTPEKGLDERLRDLIGDVRPSASASAFTVTSAAQQVNTRNYGNNGSGGKVTKVGYKATPLTLVHGKNIITEQKPATMYHVPSKMSTSDDVAKKVTINNSLSSTPIIYDQSLLRKQTTTYNQVAPNKEQKPLHQPNTAQSYPTGNVTKTKSSSSSSTSLSKTDLPDGYVHTRNDISKNPDFDETTRKQQPEAEVIVKKPKNISKVPKENRSSQPSEVHSNATILSRPRTSSLGSAASYKRRLTSAWIEQQRQNVMENKELRLRKTKSAEFPPDFDVLEDGGEIKLKHSKSEVSFDQLNAMYNPYDERPGRHRPRVVHTKEPTVIARAKSMEHKIHQVTYPRSPTKQQPKQEINDSHSKNHSISSAEEIVSQRSIEPSVVTPKLEQASRLMIQSQPSTSSLPGDQRDRSSSASGERKNGDDIAKVASKKALYESMTNKEFVSASSPVYEDMRKNSFFMTSTPYSDKKTNESQRDGMIVHKSDQDDEGLLEEHNDDKSMLGVPGTSGTPGTSEIPGTSGLPTTSGISEAAEISANLKTTGSAHGSPSKGVFYAQYVEKKAVNIGEMKNTGDFVFVKDRTCEVAEPKDVGNIAPKRFKQNTAAKHEYENIEKIPNLIKVKSSVVHAAPPTTQLPSLHPRELTSNPETTRNNGPQILAAEPIGAQTVSTPFEKQTPRNITKTHRASVRHISSSTEYLNRHDDAKAPEMTDNSATASPRSTETHSKKKRYGKVEGILHSIKLPKLRKAKSEPNLQNEPLFPELEGSQTTQEEKSEERTEILKSVSSMENGVGKIQKETENPSHPHEVSDHTTSGTEEPKRSVFSSKVSLFYPKLKKFKHKLTKHNRGIEDAKAVTKLDKTSDRNVVDAVTQKDENSSRELSKRKADLINTESIISQSTERKTESNLLSDVPVMQQDSNQQKNKVTPVLVNPDSFIVTSMSTAQDDSVQAGITRLPRKPQMDPDNETTTVKATDTTHKSLFQTQFLSEQIKETTNMKSWGSTFRSEFNENDRHTEGQSEFHRRNSNEKPFISFSYQKDVNGNSKTTFENEGNVLPLSQELHDKHVENNEYDRDENDEKKEKANGGSSFDAFYSTELEANFKNDRAHETQIPTLHSDYNDHNNKSKNDANFAVTLSEMQPEETWYSETKNTFGSENQEELVETNLQRNEVVKAKISTLNAANKDSTMRENETQRNGIHKVKISSIGVENKLDGTIATNDCAKLDEEKESEEKLKKTSSNSEKHELGTKIKGFISKVKSPFHNKDKNLKKHSPVEEREDSESNSQKKDMSKSDRMARIISSSNTSKLQAEYSPSKTRNTYNSQEKTVETDKDVARTESSQGQKRGVISKMVMNETNEYTARKTELRDTYNERQNLVNIQNLLMFKHNCQTELAEEPKLEIVSTVGVQERPNSGQSEPNTTTSGGKNYLQNSKPGAVAKFFISDTESMSSRSGRGDFEGSASENEQRYKPLVEKNTRETNTAEQGGQIVSIRQPSTRYVATATTPPTRRVAGKDKTMIKTQVDQTNVSADLWADDDDVFLPNDKRVNAGHLDIAQSTRGLRSDIRNSGPTKEYNTTTTVDTQLHEQTETTESSGVPAFLGSNDEPARKRALKYMEKVTVTRRKGAREVKRGVRKGQPDQTSHEKSELRNDQKTGINSIGGQGSEHPHFETSNVQDNHNTGTGYLQIVERVDQKTNTSLIRSKDKDQRKSSGEEERELRDDNKTDADQFTTNVITPGQVQSVPPMKRGSGSKRRNSRGGLSTSDNETQMTDSIRDTSDDELLQLIEDQIDLDSVSGDETSTMQESSEFERDTPVAIDPMDKTLEEEIYTPESPESRRKSREDLWKANASSVTTHASVGELAEKKIGMGTTNSKTTGFTRQSSSLRKAKNESVKVSTPATTKREVNVSKKEAVSNRKLVKKRSFEELNATMMMLDTNSGEPEWKQNQTGFMDIDQNHSLSFVPKNPKEKLASSEHGFSHDEVPVKQKTQPVNAHLGQNEAANEPTLRKNKSKNAQEKRKRNSQNSEDLATQIRRLLSDESTETEEKSPMEGHRHSKPSFNDDTRVGSRAKLSRQKKAYASLPSEQRGYRGHEGQTKDTEYNTRHLSHDYLSDDGFNGKISSKAFRYYSKTM